MKTNLPASINTIDEAKAFLRELHSNGESYNPDDLAEEIVWSLPKEQQPTPDECHRLNCLMKEIWGLASLSPDFDPHVFLLELDGHKWDENGGHL